MTNSRPPTPAKKKKPLLIYSNFWDSRANTLVRNMGDMLLFRFENNLWAGYSLFTEPRHVSEWGCIRIDL